MGPMTAQEPRLARLGYPPRIRPIALSELPLNDLAQASDAAEDEPRPQTRRLVKDYHREACISKERVVGVQDDNARFRGSDHGDRDLCCSRAESGVQKSAAAGVPPHA
jgi:hypothetical protein